MIKVKDNAAEEDQPAHIDMHEVDARHAVAADPKRYEIVKEDAPLTIEGRLARLEREVFGDPTPVAERNEQDVAAHNERTGDVE